MMIELGQTRKWKWLTKVDEAEFVLFEWTNGGNCCRVKYKDGRITNHLVIDLLNNSTLIPKEDIFDKLYIKMTQ